MRVIGLDDAPSRRSPAGAYAQTGKVTSRAYAVLDLIGLPGHGNHAIWLEGLSREADTVDDAQAAVEGLFPTAA